MSYPWQLTIFLYEAATLLVSFGILIRKFREIKFKQEKIKIRYVIFAFGVLFVGGMLDFTGGLKMHGLMYMGNICNVIYAALIFYAIFRLRLFGAGIVFKNFIDYTLVAVIFGAAYSAAALTLYNKTVIMVAVFLSISLMAVYFIKYLYRYIDIFVTKIGGVDAAAGANASFDYIKSLQIGESEKITNIILLVKNFLEMDAAVYVKEGGYQIIGWETEPGIFQRVVENGADTRDILIRYEARERSGMNMLNDFGASILIPLFYAGEPIGILAGKKQTADISFNQEEIDLLAKISEVLGFYMKAHALNNKMMEEENLKRIGLMAHQMAHEIKNPLTALWGAAQLLEARSEPDRENLGIIRDEIQRLTGILDSWKDFAGEVRLNQIETDISALVSDVVRMINLQEAKVKIDFVRNKTVKKAFVDPDKIKQVILNVVLNAVQASADAEKPAIRIELPDKNGFIGIKVRDNGKGIKPEIMAKIKQPLFTTKPKGSGLGLAVSERIMKAHHGSLIVESDGRTYTEVTMSVPEA
jgi:signal transduction histidine kinase